MIEPTSGDIGRAVNYQQDRGAITNFNDSYVHVRFGFQHPSASGQACRREDLVLIEGNTCYFCGRPVGIRSRQWWKNLYDQSSEMCNMCETCFKKL